MQIKITRYDAEQIIRTDEPDLDAMKEETADQGLVNWIEVSGELSRQKVCEIAESFGFHQLVIDDILSHRQRPKVETYGDQLFVIARLPGLGKSGFATRQIAIMLCHGFVLTFHDGGSPTEFASIHRRLDERIGCIRDQKQDYLIYALLDAIIDEYFPVLDRIGDRLDEVECQIADSAGVDNIAHLQNLRSTLFAIRGSIEPHQEVVSQLMREPQISQETQTYLRDCADHLSQVLHQAENSRELAADLRDYCFAEISFNQNETMKLLTVVASIFIPLSFIVGLYGMNFDSEASSWNMPELKWKFGYPIAIGVMASVVAIALGSLWWLKRRQQKQRRRRFEAARNVFE